MEHIVKGPLPSLSLLLIITNMNYLVLRNVDSLIHVHFVVDYYGVLMNKSGKTNQIIVYGLSPVKTYIEAKVSLPLSLKHLDTFQFGLYEYCGGPPNSFKIYSISYVYLF